jgi:capsular polysaccharide biosynthesis protein
LELNDAVRRIFGQQWGLIVFCLLVGLWVPMYLHWGDQSMYTASSRLVLDNQDPKTRAESAAISDIAQAIATSPTQVSQALVKAGAKGRNPVEVAKEDVSVHVLGSSGILELSVSDPSPTAAAAISNALAEGLIETRLEVTRGQVKKVDAALEERIARLNGRISALGLRVESLTLRAASAGIRESNILRRKRDEATRSRDLFAQQRAALESQRVSLISSGALNHTPSIISPAARPGRADPSGQLPDIILGSLLGLIVGVGLAGLLETIRPTLVGADAVAREFDAPLLGTLSGGLNDTDHSDELARIAALIRLAARVANVQHVGLASPWNHPQLDRLAERLEAVPPGMLQIPRVPVALSGSREGGPTLHADVPRPEKRAVAHHPAVLIRSFDPHTSSTHNGSATGLVVVTPPTVQKRALADITHLLRVSSTPLLGIVTYSAKR